MRDDASLGPLGPAGSLPEPRAGHATVVIGNDVVVSGGNSLSGGAMHLLDSTIVGRIGDDGTIATWTSGPKLEAPIMHHTCNAHGAFIYCIGGRISGNFTSRLAVRASFSDGVLSAWENIMPLAQSIAFHQA